jgi:adenylate cyclase
MLDIALHNSRQHRQFQHGNGPLLLARMGPERSIWLPIDKCKAQAAEALLEIVPAAEGIALAMAGCEAECFCGRTCGLTGQCQLPVPASFAIGDTRFEISSACLPTGRTVRPLEKLFKNDGEPLGTERPAIGIAPSTVSKWFAAIGSLNRWTTSLQELYDRATRCAVESIGLDGAMLLRRRDDRWEIAASYLPHPELGIHCDLFVLDELLRCPETQFHGSSVSDPRFGEHSAIESRHPVERLIISELPAAVVSPLPNAAGELVGAIYGYRSVRSGNARRGIRYLEAHMIELLAGAVSEGIVRLEQEAEVDRRRALLERAFAGTLHSEPRKIVSEKRELTLLFADLRRSTDLSSVFEIEELCELVGQVLDCLSAAVMDHDGVVIDYYGDGLAAMWNAPADQADHAELACRAALRMFETLPDVAADWAHALHSDLRLAVGIHTGVAQVGNAGSARRVKYGPRGPNVHIASRTEAAAKELDVPLVATRPVIDRLSNRFTTHRLCRARIRGVREPMDLYDVSPSMLEPEAAATWKNYERALSLFEHGQLTEAAESLQSVVSSTSEGTPGRFLAEHIQRELGRRRRRRSSDRSSNCPSGVITLGTK